jgi:YHS domain-containing protein
MKLVKSVTATCLMAAFLAAPWTAVAADGKKSDSAKPYPLETCLVSGEKLGGDMGEAYVLAYQGREIKLCCKSCRKDFDKDPAKFVAKWDEAAKKVKPYPLDSCVVSGEKLGAMGDAYVFVHQGQEIKLCCKGCLKDFTKNGAQYLKQLELAAKKSSK